MPSLIIVNDVPAIIGGQSRWLARLENVPDWEKYFVGIDLDAQRWNIMDFARAMQKGDSAAIGEALGVTDKAGQDVLVEQMFSMDAITLQGEEVFAVGTESASLIEDMVNAGAELLEALLAL